MTKESQKVGNRQTLLTAYIYWCTSPIMSCAKVGLWSGTLYDLWKRYNTNYGSELTLIVFECEAASVRAFEILTHQALDPWHYSGELFYKNNDSLQCFERVVTNLTFDQVSKPDRAPMHHAVREQLRQQIGFYKVPSENIKAATAPPKPKKTKELSLITAKDLTDQEFTVIRDLMAKKTAVDQDTSAAYKKHIYKTAWGIDQIDQDWIDMHGITPENKTLDLCMHILCPDTFAQEALAEDTRVVIIKEILQVFGWANPFDTDKIVALDSVFGDLLRTTLFLNFDEHIKLFNKRAKPGRDVWRKEDIFKPMQSVMKACGVEIDSTVIQRIQTKGANVHKYGYSIKSDTAIDVARLVNLRLRKRHVDLPDGVKNFLSMAGYGSYQRLLKSTSPSSSDHDGGSLESRRILQQLADSSR